MDIPSTSSHEYHNANHPHMTHISQYQCSNTWVGSKQHTDAHQRKVGIQDSQAQKGTHPSSHMCTFLCRIYSPLGNVCIVLNRCCSTRHLDRTSKKLCRNSSTLVGSRQCTYHPDGMEQMVGILELQGIRPISHMYTGQDQIYTPHHSPNISSSLCCSSSSLGTSHTGGLPSSRS